MMMLQPRNTCHIPPPPAPAAATAVKCQHSAATAVTSGHVSACARIDLLDFGTLKTVQRKEPHSPQVENDYASIAEFPPPPSPKTLQRLSKKSHNKTKQDATMRHPKQKLVATQLKV